MYRSPVNTYQIQAEGEQIAETQSLVFLGTCINSRLDWTDHIERVCAKLNSYSYALYNLRGIFDTEKLISVYYGWVYPHLSYGIVCWGQATDIGRVLICQKRVLRVMFGLSRMDSCRGLFRNNGIMTVISVYLYKLLIYIHVNKNKFVTRNEIHSHFTRASSSIQLAKISHIYYKRSPVYAGCSMYNKLPERIRKLNLKRFKIEMKGVLTSEAFYTVEDFNAFISNFN